MTTMTASAVQGTTSTKGREGKFDLPFPQAFGVPNGHLGRSSFLNELTADEVLFEFWE